MSKNAIIFFLLAGWLVSCEKYSDDLNNSSSNSSGSGSNTSSGNHWRRSDGVNTTLSFSGSTARACTNNAETIGTYNASEPSMTFAVNGQNIKFPLRFVNSNTLIVRVPSQATNTHEDVTYTRIDSYSCGSSSGGGTTAAPPTGNFRLRVYAPVGGCANATGITSFRGSLRGYWYSSTTRRFTEATIGPPSGFAQTDALGTYWESLYNNNPPTADGSRLYKIEWEFYPNVSFTFPNTCWRRGSSTIETNGQTKTVTVSWR